jgi:hypothetical protein
MNSMRNVPSANIHSFLPYPRLTLGKRVTTQEWTTANNRDGTRWETRRSALYVNADILFGESVTHRGLFAHYVRVFVPQIQSQ